VYLWQDQYQLQKKGDIKKSPLTKKEKTQLVDKMTAQVMEEMSGPDSYLRYREAEVAEEIKGKTRDEQNDILDKFAEELSEEHPFVGGWEILLKPTKYTDEEGNDATGQTILNRKTLEKNVKKQVEASVKNLLSHVGEMGLAASKGEVPRGKVELGIDERGAREFNGAVAKALVENLPEKLGGTVEINALKNKEDEYTGDIELSWTGKIGAKDVEISLFTGKPVGSVRKTT
jgi:hypothetical protein